MSARSTRRCSRAMPAFFYTDEDRIEISEDLDELTIMHEASHAWFNVGPLGRALDQRGVRRRIRVARPRRGVRRRAAARMRSPTSDGAVDLNDWAHPGRIGDEETNIREHFGYDASWTVVRRAQRDRRGLDAARSSPRQTRTTPRTSVPAEPETVTIRERLAAVPRPARADRRFGARGRDCSGGGSSPRPGAAARARGCGPDRVLRAGRRRQGLAARLRGPRPDGPLAVRPRPTRREAAARGARGSARRSRPSPLSCRLRRRPRCGRRTRESTSTYDAVLRAGVGSARDGRGDRYGGRRRRRGRAAYHIDRPDRRGPWPRSRRRRPRHSPPATAEANAGAASVQGLVTGAAEAAGRRALSPGGPEPGCWPVPGGAVAMRRRRGPFIGPVMSSAAAAAPATPFCRPAGVDERAG